jgi:hypothetical protein
MGKIVADNLQYAKVILKMGVRQKAAGEDFSDILAEEVELAMKESANVSMGTDVSAEDVTNIQELCTQVCTAVAGVGCGCILDLLVGVGRTPRSPSATDFGVIRSAG